MTPAYTADVQDAHSIVASADLSHVAVDLADGAMDGIVRFEVVPRWEEQQEHTRR